MFCRNCGRELTGTPELCLSCGARPLAGNSFCYACGVETSPLAEICVKCGVRLAKAGDLNASSKSRLITTLLAWFLGTFGVHRFYLGKIKTAVGMLVLNILFWVILISMLATPYPVEDAFWVLPVLCIAAVGIWAFVDFIMAVAGIMKDREGKVIKNW